MNPQDRKQTRDDARLRRLCIAGLKTRYQKAAQAAVARERLDRELEAIQSLGLAPTFLILHDLAQHARSRGILVSLRGSYVGTLAGFVLGCSEVDPLYHRLLWERFAATTAPEIELAVAEAGYPELLARAVQKHGLVPPNTSWLLPRGQYLLLRPDRILATIQSVAQAVGESVPLSLSVNDPKMAGAALRYVFRRGRTEGICGFDDARARAALVRLAPTSIEDLMVAYICTRPWMSSLLRSYPDRKSGRVVIPRVHPIVDRALADTFGLPLYQEQVMSIISDCSGVSLSSAYQMIKDISKWGREKAWISKARAGFRAGASAQGIARIESDAIFQFVVSSANRTFCRAQMAYAATLALRLGDLKRRWPREFQLAIAGQRVSY